MEKIWLKNYPQGVPAEINPDTYRSLAEIFEQSCELFSELPAFYNLGVTVTYQEFDRLAKRFAAYLQQELKLKKGDRIALMMPNLLQYPVALYAALRIGLIVVNVNPLYTAPELIHQLNDAEVETIVVLSHFTRVVATALPSTHLKNIIITEVGDLFPRSKAWLMHFYLKHIKKKIPSITMPFIRFRRALLQGKKYSLEPVVMSNKDIAFLQYTGGTTGISKGAMLSHRNLIANVLQADAWFSPLFTSGKEIIITALPLYHIFSLTANCLFFAKTGGLNVLITNPRDLPLFIKEIAKFKFTAITGVNTLFNALLKTPAFTQLDFSSLKMSLGGGMAIQRAVAEKWQAITGKFLMEGYGLTETSPCVTVSPVTQKEYTGTAGLPVSSTEVAILDEQGQEVPLGQSGEIAVKGPQVMQGYWRNLLETQKVFNKNGWLLTGDIGEMDSQGFLRIVDRKKDMILVSGFNVYPNEIEDTIARMKGISEVAAIGVADENSGEVVKLYIVKENPDLTISDVLHYSRANLTGYKIPKYIEFCKELPKTNVGKILRRALRNPTQENASS